VDPSFLEHKSDDEITILSKINEQGFVVDNLQGQELIGYWEVVDRPDGQV
jgi:hypothetical protein